MLLILIHILLLFLAIVFIKGLETSEKSILNIDKNDIKEKIELLKTDVKLASMETYIDSPNVITSTREHQEFNQKILIQVICNNVYAKDQKIYETICDFLTRTKIAKIFKYKKYANKKIFHYTDIEMTKQIKKEIYLFLHPVRKMEIIQFFKKIYFASANFPLNDIQIELTFENKERKKYIIKNIIEDTQNIDKEDVSETEIVLESSEDMDIITNFNLSYTEGTFSAFNTKQLHIESDDYNLLNYKVFYE